MTASIASKDAVTALRFVYACYSCGYTINGNKRVGWEYAKNGDKRCGFNLTGTPLKAPKKDNLCPFTVYFNQTAE